MIELKLDLYEVISALQDALREKYGAQLKLNNYESGVTVRERIYKAKKHKNGKVMKDPKYGYPLKEFDKYEEKHFSLDEQSEFSFYLEESLKAAHEATLSAVKDQLDYLEESDND